MTFLPLPATCLISACLFLAGCRGANELNPAAEATGNRHRGAILIRQFGCGACHSIPGIQGADGLVGPPLTMIARRTFLAGILRNTPRNMMAWIEDPQKFVPGNAMPNMSIKEDQARDIVAYLYTLR